MTQKSRHMDYTVKESREAELHPTNTRRGSWKPPIHTSRNDRRLLQSHVITLPQCACGLYKVSLCNLLFQGFLLQWPVSHKRAPIQCPLFIHWSATLPILCIYLASSLLYCYTARSLLKLAYFYPLDEGSIFFQKTYKNLPDCSDIIWKKTTWIFTNVKFSNVYKSSFISGIFVVICYLAFKNVLLIFQLKLFYAPYKNLWCHRWKCTDTG
jgi:hypothetical protein